MDTTFVDVDGHIMEPTELRQEYIEPEYRDRALRIEVDEKRLECVSVDGRKSWFGQGGTLGALGAIGKDVRPDLDLGKIGWRDAMVPGGYDPHERIKVMDAENIDTTLPVSEESKAKILWDNCARLYGFS